MSESSSDTESSCGWTLISNEGSDIETLGPETPEKGQGYEPDVPETAPELLDQTTLVTAECSELRDESTRYATSKEEETLDSTLCSEAGGEAAGDEHVTFCSSSDHSDIVTLGDVRESDRIPWEEQAEEEEAGESPSSGEMYLGTSSSSQYTFSTVETVFPLDQPVVADSSSSEDEDADQVTPVVRRRRVRRTTVTTAEPEGEAQESSHSRGEQEEEEGPEWAHQEEQQEEEEQRERLGRASRPPRHGNGTLNRCILLALVVAFSMGFGHFYGTIQTQERQKVVEKIRVNEFGDTRELPRQCPKGEEAISKELVETLRALEEEQDTVQSLSRLMEKMAKENQHLTALHNQLQAQKEELSLRLRQSTEELTQKESSHLLLSQENRLLQSSLEREEESLSSLQEELRNLRAQIRDLEERGAGADSILWENQRLKDHLEEELERVRSSVEQREVLVEEAQSLRRELDKERAVTERLRAELELMSSSSGAPNPETEELQARLAELEKKLDFEQQRSDLWERLYVETKEDRAKGDGEEKKVKKPKPTVIGKVKETFDAVKNSTKEFVHHHKEQIKKAKEAVKENLRKFSDSVKSTFRHFKDSASRVMDKATGSQEKRFHERKQESGKREQQQRYETKEDQSDDESWRHRTHKPPHRHPRKSTEHSFHDGYGTRPSGGNTQEDPDQTNHRGVPKGCSGVFDCAYQESMSLFNKAMDPIKADEFHQLLHSYLQQEVDHFHHWTELESFINSFFHNGVFIHDQMLFTDFVSGVENYLEDMDEYHGHADDVFEDLDEYVYRHFFGDTYSMHFGPSRPMEGPNRDTKEDQRPNQQQRKQQRQRPRPQRDRKWSKSGRYSDRHMADVKIELGPMPFDPKY